MRKCVLTFLLIMWCSTASASVIWDEDLQGDIDFTLFNLGYGTNIIKGQSIATGNQTSEIDQDNWAGARVPLNGKVVSWHLSCKGSDSYLDWITLCRSAEVVDVLAVLSRPQFIGLDIPNATQARDGFENGQGISGFSYSAFNPFGGGSALPAELDYEWRVVVMRVSAPATLTIGFIGLLALRIRRRLGARNLV